MTVGCSVLLLDIEGTVAPIDFVHQVLFPYARERLRGYLETNWRDDEVQRLWLALGEGNAGDPASAAAYLHSLMDVDSKSTPLKELQGRIWQSGYQNGDLVSRMFDDVRSALARWQAAGRRIAIFSSGSVTAQQSFFSRTNAGNLNGFISAYFDTNIGAKRDPASYTAIAGSLASEPGEMVFVSDIDAELDAARDAGMITVLSDRPGNAHQANLLNHPVIRSLTDLVPSAR